jgi:hypothetical protein
MNKMDIYSGPRRNECADVLATKGVMNEPNVGLHQSVTPVGEDSDANEYELLDGEENLEKDWTAPNPPGKTFIWKNAGKFEIAPPIPNSLSWQAF